MAKIAFFSCLTFATSAQLNSQQKSTTAKRDPQVLAILSQTVNAGGGSQAYAAIQDFSASGSITYFEGEKEVTGSVTLRGRGITQFRLDATLPNGTRSWAVTSGRVGAFRETDGNMTPWPIHNGLNAGAMSLPQLCIVAALNDPSTSVTNMGQMEILGRQFLRIRVQRRFDANKDPKGTMSRLTAKDFLIDPTTYMVVWTADMVHPKETFTVEYPRWLNFGDYRPVNGALVPFSVTETMLGQRIWTAQLQSVSFNTGLNDAHFQL